MLSLMLLLLLLFNEYIRGNNKQQSTSNDQQPTSKIFPAPSTEAMYQNDRRLPFCLSHLDGKQQRTQSVSCNCSSIIAHTVSPPTVSPPSTPANTSRQEESLTDSSEELNEAMRSSRRASVATRRRSRAPPRSTSRLFKPKSSAWAAHLKCN